jgi:hypothetical protein
MPRRKKSSIARKNNIKKGVSIYRLKKALKRRFEDAFLKNQSASSEEEKRLKASTSRKSAADSNFLQWTTSDCQNSTRFLDWLTSNSSNI